MPSAKNNQYLSELLSRICDQYFGGHTHRPDIQWGIPDGSITLPSETPSYQLEPQSDETQLFNMAKTLLSAGEPRKALPHLIRLAEKDHTESMLLATHVLRSFGDPRWKQYSLRYNQLTTTEEAVPAACYHPETSHIVIHSYLREKNAPRRVLTYLLYHECCHHFSTNKTTTGHNTEFMRFEMKAPHRARAMQWLQKEGFPTM